MNSAAVRACRWQHTNLLIAQGHLCGVLLACSEELRERRQAPPPSLRSLPILLTNNLAALKILSFLVVSTTSYTDLNLTLRNVDNFFGAYSLAEMAVGPLYMALLAPAVRSRHRTAGAKPLFD